MDKKHSRSSGTTASSGEEYQICQSKEGSGARSDKSKAEDSEDSDYCTSNQSTEEEDNSDCT